MSRFTVFVVPILMVAGCTGTADHTIPEPRPLGREIPVHEPAEATASGSAPENPAPTGEIVLRDALAAALLGSPRLAAASWEVRAAEARALKASLYPNPELEFEVENFGGSGELEGFDAAEMTLSISQAIPLAGRIAHRTSVAEAEGRLSGWDYESARLDVLTETARAFVAVLAAQEQVRLAEDAVKLGEEADRVTGEKVAAGKASPLESREAQVALSLERVRLARVRRTAETARRSLAATWGEPIPEFTSVLGDLRRIPPVPPAAALLSLLDENPDLARWDDAVLLSRSRLESERASAWPDLTLTGGVKEIRELDAHAFLLGFSVPLPLFDRNQSGVDAAAATTRRVEAEHRAARVRIEAELRTAWSDLRFAAAEARALSEDVLPGAREAFEAAREGFGQGKFTYLELLVAQRALFTTREMLIASLATCHQAVADVERRIGRSLTEVETEKQP
ncbi:MAG: TolC family protein [Planctomycetota bacterium]